MNYLLCATSCSRRRVSSSLMHLRSQRKHGIAYLRGRKVATKCREENVNFYFSRNRNCAHCERRTSLKVVDQLVYALQAI